MSFDVCCDIFWTDFVVLFPFSPFLEKTHRKIVSAPFFTIFVYFWTVWPGPEAPKPPHFCRKTPPLAGKFSTPIFTRQIARHYRKKAHFMLFLPFYCIFMSLGLLYMEHLKIILSKIEKNCIWIFKRESNLALLRLPSGVFFAKA